MNKEREKAKDILFMINTCSGGDISGRKSLCVMIIDVILNEYSGVFPDGSLSHFENREEFWRGVKYELLNI